MGVGDISDPKNLSEAEKDIIRKVWSNPLLVEEQFKSWLRNLLEGDPPTFLASQLIGLNFLNTRVVTELPSDPGDGARVIFDTGQTGVYWSLVFSEAAGLWVCVGGTPISDEVTTAEVTTSTTYTDLTTVGPQLETPLTGAYIVEIGATANIASAGNTARATVKVGAAAASDNNCVRAPNVDASVSRQMPLDLTAGDDILVQYRGTTGLDATFRNRFITMIPKTVS